MLDSVATIAPAGLRVRAAPALPVEQLVVGKPVDEVAVLLPRLFSACRAAQGLAANLALGLSPAPEAHADVAQEVLRDHLMKLALHLPARLCLPPRPLPQGWRDGAGVAEMLFGAEAPPDTPDAFEAFLLHDAGVAPVLRRIDQCFAPGEAVSGQLPALGSETAFDVRPCENSVAGRQAHHPVMRHIAQTRGRGPLWRATARMYDAADALAGTLPPPLCPGPRRAVVTAARGAYALDVAVEGGVLTGLHRVTPTDHLQAPGGILSQALATLREPRDAVVALLLEVLDPCSPLRVECECKDA